MKYDKVQLSYAFDALEPYIDAETVEIHYTKHLQGYVNKLNALLEGYEYFTDDKSLAEILSDIEGIPDRIRTGVINQGGGVLNHNLYFSILSPTPKRKPEGALYDDIVEKYGSLEKCIDKLSKVTIDLFGSGYGWLILDNERNLDIIITPNQVTPVSLGFNPLLTIDVWEHAYYLKYKNLRAEYVKNIWNIIDWRKVEENYEKKY